MVWWMVDPASLGDPAGMRSLARQLSNQAQAVAQAARRPTQRLGRQSLAGPFATRLRASLKQREQSTIQIAHRLNELAGAINRSASEVEAEQHRIRAERARQDQLRREREARERAAREREAQRRREQGG